MNTLKVSLALIVVILVWSSAFVGIRYGLHEYHPGSMALFRYLIASLFMLFFYLPIKNKQCPNLKELLLMFLFGLTGFTIYNVALNYGEITVTAGISSFLIGCMPVLAALIAILFLGERITKIGYLGMGASLVGVALIALGECEGTTFDWGIVYVLIATICSAIYSGLHKSLLKKFSAIEFITYVMSFGTLAMLIYTPQLIHDIRLASPSSTLDIIYMGIFPGAIGFALWSYVLSQLPVTRGTSFLYLLPLITTAMSVLLLHEKPPLTSFCGGLVALGGAILVNLAKHKMIIIPAKAEIQEYRNN